MYELNPELAKKADAIGAYLSDTGKYVGTFIRAEKLISANKGTDGIGFTFKDESGRSCRFDVWTKKVNGEALSGLNQINAMMACFQLRGLKESPQNVSKWDNNVNAETIQSAPCFVDLMNKRIGLLLRSTEYAKMKEGVLTGENGWRMELFSIFQADTELMASEILTRKTKPEQLEKVVAQLADKPLKKTSAQRPAASYGGSDLPSDFGNDIPF